MEEVLQAGEPATFSQEQESRRRRNVTPHLQASCRNVRREVGRAEFRANQNALNN